MIIRNLLQNALGHTEANVHIAVADQTLRIQDFGKGLNKSVIENISAVSRPGTRKLDQSSFGLLIVQLACERLNWRFQVEKSDAEGTVFLVLMKDLVS